MGSKNTKRLAWLTLGQGNPSSRDAPKNENKSTDKNSHGYVWQGAVDTASWKWSCTDYMSNAMRVAETDHSDFWPPVGVAPAKCINRSKENIKWLKALKESNYFFL